MNSLKELIEVRLRLCLKVADAPISGGIGTTQYFFADLQDKVQYELTLDESQMNDVVRGQIKSLSEILGVAPEKIQPVPGKIPLTRTDPTE